MTTIFKHNVVPTHSAVSPVENLATEVSEAFERLSKLLSTTSVIPSLSDVIGDYLNLDIEYYGFEKELTESISVNNGSKDLELTLLPTRTTNITASYLDPNTGSETYLTLKLPDQEFTDTNQFKVVGKVISLSGDFSGRTIKVKYSGIRENFGNLQLRPNVVKKTDNTYLVPLTKMGNKVYEATYDFDVAANTEKIFGSAVIDKEKVRLLLKQDDVYKQVNFVSVHTSGNKVVYELEEELDDNYDSVTYIINTTISDFLLAFYKEYKQHSHDKDDITKLISHTNLIDLYKNTEEIFYKGDNIPNYEHPQYLNREGYNPSVSTAYENALLGDLFLASKINKNDQNFKSLLKNSNSIMFGDPVQGSRIYYDTVNKTLNLLTGAGLNGLNVDVSPENKAFTINNTSYLKETDDSLTIFGKNSTVKVVPLNISEKSKLSADIIKANQSIEAEHVDTNGLSLGNVKFENINGDLKIGIKDDQVTEPTDINIEVPMNVLKLDAGALTAVKYTINDGDRILTSEHTSITKQLNNDGLAIVSDKALKIHSSGRHTGVEIGNEEELSTVTYTANYLGQPASHVDTSVYTETPVDADLYLLKSTKDKLIDGTKTYKFGNEQEQGVINIQSLKDWKRSGIHSGDSSAYNLKLNVSEKGKKNGLSIGDTRLYTFGTDVDCPEGMTILESKETVSIIKPLGQEEKGCGDISYQSVNTGNLQVFGSVAVDDTITAVENITAGESVIGRNLRITESSVLNDLTTSGNNLFAGESVFNNTVKVNNSFSVVGSTDIKGHTSTTTLNVEKFATVNGALTVEGQSTLNGDVSIQGKINTSSGFTTSGPVVAESIKAGNIRSTGGLEVQGSTLLDGNVHLKGNMKADGNLEVVSEIITNSLHVRDDAVVQGRLTVLSDIALSGNVISLGAKTSSLLLNGNTQFNSDDSTFAGNVGVLKNLVVSGNIEGSKDLKVANKISGASLEIKSAAKVEGQLTADSGEFNRKTYFNDGIDVQGSSVIDTVEITKTQIDQAVVDDLLINKSLTTGPAAVLKSEKIETSEFSQTSQTGTVTIAGPTTFFNSVHGYGHLIIGNKDIERNRNTSGVLLSDKELRMGMNSVIKSTKLFAAKGIPSGGNLDLNAGFCFESSTMDGGTDGDTGMFATVGTGSGLDGSDLEFWIDGVRRGIITKRVIDYTDTTNTSDDTLIDLRTLREVIADLKAVTRGVQASIIDKVYPVGSIYITTNDQDPADLLGVGIWQRFAAGRTLVGKIAPGEQGGEIAGNYTPPSNWDLKAIGSYYGDYTHKLVIDEIPMHSHRYVSDDQAHGSGGGTGRRMGRDFSQQKTSGNAVEWHTDRGFPDESGGDKPHNNVQPSVVVAIWQRIR